MNAPPAILFVTDKFPWPLDDGGQIRTYQILKHLAARFSVILVALASDSPQCEEPIRDMGIEVVTFPARRPPWMTPWRILQALFTTRPYPLPKNFSFEILTEIRRRITAGSIRALHLNHLDAAQYLDRLEGVCSRVKVVFDTHNVLTSLYGRLVEAEQNPLRKTYCRIQWQKMRYYEHATMRKADCVVVCSEAERQVLDDWRVQRCVVAPNGVDTQFFTPRPVFARAEGRPLHMVFTGAMDYFPNADGVRWFLRSVVPELNRTLARYKLTIVGKNPPADILACQRQGQIEFTGRVADIRPYARSADLFVVPLQVGGGTRLKILEALAMQLPVVSTRVGAEGLDLHDGIHLRLADDAPGMARAITELWTRSDRAQAMARRGREQVFGKYEWRTVTLPLCRYYEQALSGA